MFRDQFETFAPILTVVSVAFVGVAIYVAVRGEWRGVWGALGVAGVCAVQAVIGWRQRRRRGDDKWSPM